MQISIPLSLLIFISVAVGYESRWRGTNSTQWKLTNCQSGRTYCGGELGASNNSGLGRAIFRCPAGKAALQQTCANGCFSTGNTSKCQCFPGKRYCGHGLANVLAWQVNHTQYRSVHVCSIDGVSAVVKEECKGKCVLGSCIPSGCSPGGVYCGSALNDLGWTEDEYNHDGLYTCNAENEPYEVERCFTSCSSFGGTHCTKSCSAGTLYCGWELRERNYNISAAWYHLFRCDSDGSNVSLVQTCERTCNGANPSRCTCEVGKSYCGHDLVALQWNASAYSQKGIYRCNRDGLSTTIVKECGTSCSGSGDAHCETICKNGTYYCGHELYGSANSFDNLNLLSHFLYRCDPDGKNINLVKSCGGSCISDENSYCEVQNCEPDGRYCGNELTAMNWNAGGLLPSALHLCGSSGYTSSALMNCSNCIPKGPSSFCGCQPAKKYCGKELQSSLFWTVDDNGLSNIHQCESSGSSLAWNISVCTEGCYSSTTGPRCNCSSTDASSNQACSAQSAITAAKANASITCAAGSYRCGHELQGITYDSESLYKCPSNSTTPTFVKSCPSKCFSAPQSYCDTDCVPDKLYCGYQLQFTGRDPRKTLYRCNNTASVDIVQKCTDGCIVLPSGSQCDNSAEEDDVVSQTTGNAKRYSVSANPQLFTTQPASRIPSPAGLSRTTDLSNRSTVPATASSAISTIGQPVTTSPTTVPINWTEREITTTEPELADATNADSALCGVASIGRFRWDVRASEGTYGQWPWMASLFNNNGDQYCGGVILSNRWVLTAAHCLVEGGPATVFVGKFSTIPPGDDGEQQRDVNTTLTHYAFDQTMQRLDHDIGLIQLDKPTTFGTYVKPVCLPTETESDILPDKQCVTIGWGYTDNDTLRATTMLTGRVKILRDEECNSTGDPGKFISTSMLCAGGIGKSVPSVCPGDNGGPLLCQRTNTESDPWLLYGIASWKVGAPMGLCGPRVDPFAFTKVTAFSKWIKNATKNSDN